MRYVAFLRAINVGGRVVKMEVLRRVFTKAGMKDVETFIASGNVLFESDDDPDELEPHLEAAIEKSLGLTSETFLRTGKQLAVVARCTAFPELRGELPRDHGLWIGFMRARPPRANQAAVAALANATNEFRFRAREVYWHSTFRPSMLKITGRPLDRALGVRTTFRGYPSVKKLAEMLR